MTKTLIISLLMLFQQAPSTFTGIEYVQGSDSLKVSVRIDYDLFLRDYQQTVFDDLDIEVLRNMKPFPADLANSYLNLKIHIHANRKEVIGKLIKMEEHDGDIWFNLLYRADRKLKRVTVHNALLTGFSSRIENYVIFKAGNFEDTAKLTPGHETAVFIIDR